MGKLRLTRVQWAQALFFANAVIWVLLGAVTVRRMSIGRVGQQSAALIVGILMVGNAGAMLVSGIGLGKRSRLFYLFALGVLLVNLVLTVTDEFGLLDLLTGVLDLALLGLLITIRDRYSAPR